MLKEFPLNKIWLYAGCGHQIYPGWRKTEEVKLLKETKTYTSDGDLNSLGKHKSLAKLTLSNLEQLPSEMAAEHLESSVDIFIEQVLIKLWSPWLVQVGFKNVRMRVLLSFAQTIFVAFAIFEFFVLKLFRLWMFLNFRLTILHLSITNSFGKRLKADA